MFGSKTVSLRQMQCMTTAIFLVAATAAFLKPFHSFRRRTYLTRKNARQEVFEYIEMFYNPKRKHTNNGLLSPPLNDCKQSPVDYG